MLIHPFPVGSQLKLPGPTYSFQGLFPEREDGVGGGAVLGQWQWRRGLLGGRGVGD